VSTPARGSFAAEAVTRGHDVAVLQLGVTRPCMPDLGPWLLCRRPGCDDLTPAQGVRRPGAELSGPEFVHGDTAQAWWEQVSDPSIGRVCVSRIAHRASRITPAARSLTASSWLCEPPDDLSDVAPLPLVQLGMATVVDGASARTIMWRNSQELDRVLFRSGGVKPDAEQLALA
jgi:hypothetical protein